MLRRALIATLAKRPINKQQHQPSTRMASTAPPSNCIFCKIVSHQSESEKIVYEDDDFAVFPDIRPAAAHHYLVVTKTHIPNPNALAGDADALTVCKMVELAKSVMREKTSSEIDAAQLRIGFHTPPLISVHHLHMHAIYPASDMSWWHRMIFPESKPWFQTPEYVIERVRAKASSE